MKTQRKVLGLAAIITAIAISALLITGCGPDPEPEGPALDSITVTPPTKTDYTVGDELDTTGMVVTAKYNDDTTKTVTGTLSGYDKTKAGTQTITVTFEGKTATFTVTVSELGIRYIITSSGTSFTAKKGTETVGTTGAIQNVIEAIRTDAKGEDCTIQFGDGTTVLNIGTQTAAGITFSNTGGTWGAVTLSGKITAAHSAASSRTILIDGPITVTSTGEIAGTGTAGSTIRINSNIAAILNITGGKVSTSATLESYAINNSSTTGRVNISGGTVESTGGNNNYSVLYSGGTSSTVNINITGGTVSTTTGTALENSGRGSITISGGTISATTGIALKQSYGNIAVSGSATITSANTDDVRGTIYNYSGVTGTVLNITGGTVVNTSTAAGNAIYNNSSSNITISGGTITKAGTTGCAVKNASTSTGTVTITKPPAVIEGKVEGVQGYTQ